MSISTNFESQNYSHAAKYSERFNAMDAKLKAMHSNNTWTIVALTSKIRIIHCIWVYKLKFGSNGQIERHKARIVAKGFSQQEGVNFF